MAQMPQDSMPDEETACTPPQTLQSNSSLPFIPRMARDLGIVLNSKRRDPTISVPIRGFYTAGIDHDTSGNYHPDQDTPPSPVTPPRPRRPRTHNVSTTTKKRGKKCGYGFLVSLAFEGEKGKDFLRNLDPGPHDKNLSKEEISDSESESESESGSDKDQEPGSRIRRSKRERRPKTGISRDDGLTLNDLSLGHPQRRGCKACFETGDDDCSLIQHSDSYPCVACHDASVDCELIIAPTLKRPCENCKGKRVSCSYKVDGGKAVATCENCEDEGLLCCAGPLAASGSSRYDDVLGQLKKKKKKKEEAKIAETPKRKYVSCDRCRFEKLHCNLKRDQPGPCTKCVKSKEECIFWIEPAATKSSSQSSKKIPQKGRKRKPLTVSLDAKFPDEPRFREKLSQEVFARGVGRGKDKKIRKTKKQTKQQGNKRRPSPEIVEVKRVTNGIPHTKIRTAFAHPISFNYVPPPGDISPCSWCASPFFGLYGHGELLVEVILWPDGNGYEEVGDAASAGHNMRGMPKSTMCMGCTFERVSIINCDSHEIKFMANVDQRIFDHDSWKASVLALENGDEEGGKLITNAKWCSICSNVAEYHCCCPQVLSKTGQLLAYGEKNLGCGLCLCENCKLLLEDMEMEKSFCMDRANFNVLDRLVAAVQEDLASQYTDSGLRADASFLTSGGELLMRLQSGMGSEPAESGRQDLPPRRRGASPSNMDNTKNIRVFKKPRLDPGNTKQDIERSFNHERIDTESTLNRVNRSSKSRFGSYSSEQRSAKKIINSPKKSAQAVIVISSSEGESADSEDESENNDW